MTHKPKIFAIWASVENNVLTFTLFGCTIQVMLSILVFYIKLIKCLREKNPEILVGTGKLGIKKYLS